MKKNQLISIILIAAAILLYLKIFSKVPSKVVENKFIYAEALAVDETYRGPFSEGNPPRYDKFLLEASKKEVANIEEVFNRGTRYKFRTMDDKGNLVEERLFNFSFFTYEVRDCKKPCSGEKVTGQAKMKMKYAPNLAMLQLYADDKLLAEKAIR